MSLPNLMREIERREVSSVSSVPYMGISGKIGPSPAPVAAVPDLALMRRIRELFDNGVEVYSKYSLMALVCALNVGEKDFHYERDKARLVAYLRSFGIEPHTMTIKGIPVEEAFEEGQFKAAFALCNQANKASGHDGP